jgi:hypothetical protein
MMTKKWDKMWVGVLVGLAGGFVGFIIYGLYYSFSHHIDIMDFVNRVFLGHKILRAPILSLSILFNIIPFYLFLNKKHYKGARGVMLSIFIYAIAIVYYRFFS